MEMGTTTHKSELSSEEKESLSKVDDAFSHLDWSSKTDHITNEESKQKGLHGEHDGFDTIPIEETEISSASAENSSRSVQIHHIEPAENHSSLANVHSSPEPEPSGPNFQGGQPFNDTSAQEEPEVDDSKIKPNSETSRDAETGGAAAATAEWSDNNSDVFLSDTHTPSSSTPSSPPKFDEDILEAGMVETRSQLTELKI
jgi:hypothetical protein